MTYVTDIATSQDDLLMAIQDAADAAGWTVNRAGTLGSDGLAGREALLEKDGVFVNLRSVALVRSYYTAGGSRPNIDGPAVLIRGSTGFDSGEAWNTQPGTLAHPQQGTVYVGPQPFEGNTSNPDAAWQTISWPAEYHIFTFEDPDMLVMVLQHRPGRYQWLMFGGIVKFGSWTGGGFFGASGTPKTTGGGTFFSQPAYSVGGESTNRSYAPFHLMRTGFNQNEFPDNVTNTFVHVDTGGSDAPEDDIKWTYNAIVNPFDNGINRRRVVANNYAVPINSRSPNVFNAVAVMVPYVLVTQRVSHHAVIGRLAHVRHLPIDHFNPEDTFDLGPDTWMVFPYFEKNGLTGRFGWAIRRSSGS